MFLLYWFICFTFISLSSIEVQQRETSLLDKISTLESQVIQMGIQEKTCSNNEEEHLESIQDLSLTSNVSDLVSQLKLKDEETNLLLSKSEAMQAQLKTLEENYEQQKDGFVEELNKMNDVLKQRGEAITRLEEKCQTNEKEFKVSKLNLFVDLKTFIHFFFIHKYFLTRRKLKHSFN